MSDPSAFALDTALNPSLELSIIVPVYNASAVLRRCINSILSQDFKEFEILLIDDGSTDDSGDICDAYASAEPRVRAFHTPNAGPSAARNAGLVHAAGRYIQFVDADDELEQGCLSVFRRNCPDATTDLLVAGALIVGPEGAQIDRTSSPVPGLHRTGDVLRALTPETKATLLHYVWNKWYLLPVIRSHGLRFDVDVRLGEDFLFNCSYIARCESVLVTDEITYRYYAGNPGSLTRSHRHDELSRRRLMDAALAALYDAAGVRDESDVMLSELVGAIALESLHSVFLPGCHLGLSDGLGLIREFVDSEYRRHIEVYGSSDSCHGVRRTECWLIARGSVLGAYGTMWAVSRAKALTRVVSPKRRPNPATTRL